MVAKKARTVRKKRKDRKNIERGQAHIQSTFNNTIVTLSDVQGNVISNQQLTNVLNQTYPLELSTQRSGIYLIQATGTSFNEVMRIFVNH